MATDTIYRELQKVASIKTLPERTAAFRQLLAEKNDIAIIVQYTFRRDIEFDVKDETEHGYRKSRHDEAGPLYRGVRSLYQFIKGKTTLTTKQKEENFLALYESVAEEDADILMAIKNKKLPFRNLGEAFVREAAPELFLNEPKEEPVA